MPKIHQVDFSSFAKSVPEILELSGLAKLIAKEKVILLKPNLTLNNSPPCTTPVQLIEEVVKFCQKHSPAKIIIAEGSGGCDTAKAFADLGYQTLGKKYRVGLVDLNRAERMTMANSKAKVLMKVRLPKIIFTGFFINLPVLKRHHNAKITGATKNLFGIYLNENVLLRRLTPNWWNKSELHFRYGVPQSIHDLNLYRPSDFILLDASVGQAGHEIYGSPCQPPIGKLIAGFDNLEVDRFCAPLLGLDPSSIPYLNY